MGAQLTRSRTMWVLLSAGVNDSDDLAVFRNMLRLVSKRQFRALRGHLDSTLETVSVVDLVDGDGCRYVGDAKVAAAVMLLGSGRDRTAEAIAAGVAMVPEPVERGLELVEVLEAAGEEPEADWTDGKLIFSVKTDLADFGAPDIARGFELAKEVVQSDKDLLTVIDSGEVKSIYFKIFPWHLEGTVEPPKLSRRNGRCKVSAEFDLDTLPEDQVEVAIELAIDLVRRAGVRFKLPVADLVRRLELVAVEARNH